MGIEQKVDLRYSTQIYFVENGRISGSIRPFLTNSREYEMGRHRQFDKPVYMLFEGTKDKVEVDIGSAVVASDDGFKEMIASSPSYQMLEEIAREFGKRWPVAAEQAARARRLPNAREAHPDFLEISKDQEVYTVRILRNPFVLYVKSASGITRKPSYRTREIHQEYPTGFSPRQGIFAPRLRRKHLS